MYKYTFEFGFTDYNECDYQEMKVEISSPVNLHNLFPNDSLKSLCFDTSIARMLVECTRLYNPYSVRHVDSFRVEKIKEKETE